MNIVVLYHPESDHARKVLTFQHDFENLTAHKIDLLSMETLEGSEKAKLYGVTQYPAIMVVGVSGDLQKLWEGDNLPQINEVISYTL